MTSKKKLTPKEAAKKLKLASSTLAQYRYKKIGPPYYKFKGTVYYIEEELEQWVKENTVRVSH